MVLVLRVVHVPISPNDVLLMGVLQTPNMFGGGGSPTIVSLITGQSPP